MQLSDSILKSLIKDLYFERSSQSHKEFSDWANKMYFSLYLDYNQSKDLNVSEITKETLMDIDAQWDLYLVNTYSINQLQTMDLNKVKLPNSYFANWYRLLNFESMGYAERFGESLRLEIEEKLIEDLQNYSNVKEKLHFNWSDTCIEGHFAEVKGGTIENLSNVLLVNYKGEIVYEGWFDFIFDDKSDYFFEVYWDFLSFKSTPIKKFGIPSHIWEKIPSHLKSKYRNKLID